jgi:hypothetical protein
VVNSLVAEHVISEKQAHNAKVQYEELHRAVLSAMATETVQLTEAKVLQKQLSTQESRAAENRNSLDTLNSQVHVAL